MAVYLARLNNRLLHIQSLERQLLVLMSEAMAAQVGLGIIQLPGFSDTVPLQRYRPQEQAQGDPSVSLAACLSRCVAC
ncbi:MAG: hypothetical protein P8J79_14965 [Halioglobus sp.]|nr:hypothetical protein [Halioglobus sp.]